MTDQVVPMPLEPTHAVQWSDGAGQDDQIEIAGLHWKTLFCREHRWRIESAG